MGYTRRCLVVDKRRASALVMLWCLMHRGMNLRRFWSLIEVSDCWDWRGRIDRDGYGRYGKRGVLAHRVTWTLLVGPIPDGYHVDHLCRNKGCVNPDHLEPVTAGTNVRRTPPGMKGRHHNRVNSRKTECMRGHPLSGQNLYVTPSGYRNCKTCRREANRAFVLKRPGYWTSAAKAARLEARQ